MGSSGMVLSGIAAVAGAIMYWAVSVQASTAAQSHGFRLTTVGVILMIAGVLGFIASSVVFATSRRTPSVRRQSTDRVTVDTVGATTELHETKN
jgi:ammonia channel protein AmtB